ncbi:hypothetical protein [Rhodococcus wratislaviensis]|uniref:hypothetical protein n=1 Tax=Rhodococcus wratislaviensis TaxID=44752 RepID=UPI0036464D01
MRSDSLRCSRGHTPPASTGLAKTPTAPTPGELRSLAGSAPRRALGSVVAV